MQKKLTVSQLNKYIGGVFDDEIVLHDVTVCGEVFECRRTGARTFITLREGDCSLSCVSFCKIDDVSEGMNVEAVGTVGFYAKTGRVSFLIEDLSPVGEGRLAVEFAKLKAKLQGEGLFQNRPPLPAKINKIAVITSEYGAVLHDIISVVRSKNPFTDICVYDVRVQGADSAATVAAAIKEINDLCADIDVMIVARGGGSAEDLQAYNTETVARAVAASKIPIVSAVGHETDYTLCDLCASYRAGTPSIAADVVTEPIMNKIARVRSLSVRMGASLARKFESVRNRLTYRAMAVVNRSEINLERKEERVKTALRAAYARLDAKTAKKGEKIAFVAAMLDRVSPLRVLAQGYAKVTLGGKEVTSANELTSGDEINVVMKDGGVKAKVL